jgi:Ca2+/H+ antiporter
LNLALGSALASIGLTIPVVAGVSIVIRQPPLLARRIIELKLQKPAVEQN